MFVLLEVADVSFRYGKPGRASHPERGAPLVLDRVTTAVAEGALVGLLGPNGSGKSTLLKLIAGVLTPAAGRVTLDGVDTSSIPRTRLARRLAVVPQETELVFDYSALEMVLMGRYPHLGPFEMEGPIDLELARQAMTQTGTEALASRAFRTLSGGEKQRVVIASALAQLAPGPRPGAVLLLDEPTASLDLKYQFEMAALLRRLHDTGGLTIIVSTHDLRFAERVATEVVLLANRRVLAQGAPVDVLTPERVGTVYDLEPALVATVLARR